MKLPARYKPEKTLAPGGFGATSICLDERLARRVVIKQSLHPKHLKRIVDEIVALQRAKSRHVVEMFDVVIDNTTGEIGIVEEFLPGNDLIEFYKLKPTAEDFCRALYQVASGLRDVHECEIVHRDMKPNNMKYDQDGALKIFDFGLAKSALPGSTTGIIGTPGFMAPELFLFPPIIDKPVDVYAFGATAYCLATGAPPPNDQTTLVPPKALPAGTSIKNLIPITDPVATQIDACLNLDAASRPTMAAVAATIQRELLFDKHKGLAADGSTTLEVNKANRKIKARRGTTDSIEIEYDGYDFKIVAIVGFVTVNNSKAAIGQLLNGSFVITLGASGARRFVTFDVSHPEVLI